MEPLQVKLRVSARKDVRDILNGSERQWGPTQRAHYEREILAALDVLAHNPELGPDRSQLGPGIRIYRVQQHIIYYRIGPNVIRVLRILHQRMNAADYLS